MSDSDAISVVQGRGPAVRPALALPHGASEADGQQRAYPSEAALGSEGVVAGEMALGPQETDGDKVPTREAWRPGDEEPAAEASEPAFQFSVRHLLAATAAAAAFMAVLARLGGLSGVAAAWLAVLVAGHVLATAWGTTAKRRSRQRARMPEEPDCGLAQAQVRYAPPTRLRENTRLSRIVPIVCAAGALVGAVVGTLLLIRANWDRLTLSSMLVGAASCAVIGGFVSFLASSFVTVASSAARQARTEQSPPRGGDRALQVRAMHASGAGDP